MKRVWTWIGSVVCLAVSGGIYFWLWPHLGSMNSPVLLYVIVITIMVTGAWSVLGDDKLTLAGRFLVFTGALSFYFSDVFVARDRFLKTEILNRLIGLPLYYFGQFFSNLENLVLWARSELTGYAEEKCRGMMEYWKVGIMGSEG